MAIPRRWNIKGLLSPANLDKPHDSDRSPYRGTLAELVERFGATPQRRVLLDGLLRYRAALHAAGLVSGFQWLDGSFTENVEELLRRPPNDLDLVTFYELPPDSSQQELLGAAPHLFDRAQMKAAYRVDAFYEHLGTAPRRAVEASAYWYGLYSHRRKTLEWKGFVQVELDPAGDVAAAAALAALDLAGAVAL